MGEPRPTGEPCCGLCCGTVVAAVSLLVLSVATVFVLVLLRGSLSPFVRRVSVDGLVDLPWSRCSQCPAFLALLVSQVPRSWWLGGLVLSTLACILGSSIVFALPWWEPLLSISLSLVVAFVAVRALGTCCCGYSRFLYQVGAALDGAVDVVNG